jgi:putative endonuclease
MCEQGEPKMKHHIYYVYILFNRRNGTLYTGVTNGLIRRTLEHKNKKPYGFAEKHGANKLGYFEKFGHINNAIAREKQIKDGSRKKKLDLIESMNPSWEDLFDRIEEFDLW